MLSHLLSHSRKNLALMRHRRNDSSRWMSSVRLKRDRLPSNLEKNIILSESQINGQTITIQNLEGQVNEIKPFTISPKLEPFEGNKFEPKSKFSLDFLKGKSKQIEEENHFPDAKLTVLSNGLRVASQPTYSPTSSLAFFVDAGIQYEDDSNHGSSILWEKMTFKATNNRDTKSVVREMEEFGGNVTTTTSRDLITYSCDSLRQDFPKLMDLMSDVIFNPKLDAEEMKEQNNLLIEDCRVLQEEGKIEPYLSDIVHNIAYQGQPLGRGVLPESTSFENLTVEGMKDYRNKYWTPSRVVLSVSGEEHDTVVDLANQYLGKIHDPKGVIIPPVQSVYTGGFFQYEVPEDTVEGEGEEGEVDGSRQKEKEMSQTLLAFESKGNRLESTFILSILYGLLGGGGSFSSGGPGKGMYSRVYRNILNGHSFVDSAFCFMSNFATTGLFGIHGTSYRRDNALPRMLDVIVHELLLLLKSISREEFKRAQNQAKSQILMALESNLIIADDIGRQFFLYGKRLANHQIVEGIDSVTIQDLQNEVRWMLSTEPTLLLVGTKKELEEAATREQVRDHIRKKIQA